MSPATNAGLKTGLVRAAVRAAVLTGFTACAAVGCGSTPPRDQNYGTDLGADFVAPVVDASGTAAQDGAAGAAGDGGAQAGSGGAAGTGTGGEAGTGGTGVTDLAGADGAAGAGS
jgi:hypothetical protein